jgi:NADH:ubiquinone oxidoreductase subunit C
LEKEYERDIKDGVFKKPKLPNPTKIKSIKDMEDFQQEFNTYLIQLAQNPTDEFIRFLITNKEQNFTNTSSNFTSMLTINKTNSSYSFNIDLIREFWSTETLAKVTLNLNEFGTEEFTYVIQIIYKDESYRIQKKRAEAIEFYDRMIQHYKIKRSKSLSGSITAEVDKTILKDVEDFYMQVLNNANLYCDEVWDYFGYNATKTPRLIHSILQSQEPILKDFKVIGKVDKVEFKLDKKKNIQIVYFR